MDYNERKQRLNELWYSLLQSGKVTSKKELAERMGISYSTICNAFGTHEPSLTPSLLKRVEVFTQELLGDDSIIISDELNHASIIDGVRLCKAQRARYKHADMDELENCLKESQSAKYR